MNIALVGAGRHSIRNHAPALKQIAREIAEVRLAAVCDLDIERAESARDEFGFECAFTSLDDMASAVKIDAAVLIMPVPSIISMAKRFIAEGMPVCIEKPLGTRIEEARDFAEFVEAHDTPAMVSLNRRFDPGVRTALEWLAQRSELRAVHGIMLRDQRREADFVWSTGIHLIDLLTAVAGPLVLREALTPTRTGRLAVLRSARGVDVSMEMLPEAGRQEDRLHLAGIDCFVDVQTGPARPWHVEAYEKGKLAFTASVVEGTPEYIYCGAYDETRAFVDMVLNGTAPDPSVRDALVSSEVAAQLHALTQEDA